MNPATITALFSGIVLVIGAAATAYIRIRVALRDIHAMVNSNLTDALDRIASLQRDVQALELRLLDTIPKPENV